MHLSDRFLLLRHVFQRHHFRGSIPEQDLKCERRLGAYQYDGISDRAGRDEIFVCDAQQLPSDRRHAEDQSRERRHRPETRL